MQYEQLNDLQVQFESSLQRQDELHAKFDLNLTTDNLKVAALQAEEHAEAIAEQFLSGILLHSILLTVVCCHLALLCNAWHLSVNREVV